MPFWLCDDVKLQLQLCCESFLATNRLQPQICFKNKGTFYVPLKLLACINYVHLFQLLACYPFFFYELVIFSMYCTGVFGVCRNSSFHKLLVLYLTHEKVICYIRGNDFRCGTSVSVHYRAVQRRSWRIISVLLENLVTLLPLK